MNLLVPTPKLGTAGLDGLLNFLTSEISKYEPGPGVVSSMYSYSSESESSSILVEGGAFSDDILLSTWLWTELLSSIIFYDNFLFF